MSVRSYIGSWRVNASSPVPEAVLQNVAGNWVGPRARFATNSLNLPASVASADWANVDFAASGEGLSSIIGHLTASRLTLLASHFG